jgi:hypothetical protein
MKKKDNSPPSRADELRVKATELRGLKSIPSLLVPTGRPAWIKKTQRNSSKTEAQSQLALKLACLWAEGKKALPSKSLGPTTEEFNTLFEYAFGAGRRDAQLIAAFYVQYQDSPDVRKHLDYLIGNAAARGDTDFLRELAKARKEQKRNPSGWNRWRAFLMARKVQGKPGMTVSSLGKLIDPEAKNSSDRASADQTARRALTDTGMFIPDKRGFKKGAKRTPRASK